MKKLGLLLCGIIIVILGLVFYINYNDKSYFGSIKKEITNNTDIKEIKYINVYNNNYIVLNDEYLYLVDDKYNIILEVEEFLIHENRNNYDIIYNDNRFMYLNDVYQDNKLVYEYYDIYTYELIKKVIVGGNDGTGN